MPEQNHCSYEFGSFHLDATRRILLKEGQPLKLFPKEVDTLLALVEHGGELLEKDDLMRRVWQDATVEESNLTTNISHLRKVLGESRDRQPYIVTVPGDGYRFVAGVRQAFDQVVVHDRTTVTIDQSVVGGSLMSIPGAADRTSGFNRSTRARRCSCPILKTKESIRLVAGRPVPRHRPQHRNERCSPH